MLIRSTSGAAMHMPFLMGSLEKAPHALQRSSRPGKPGPLLDSAPQFAVTSRPAARIAAMSARRVGVIFGGRSGEHEVSLASAASVIGALERSGHAVVPIGIGRDGRWVVGGDALGALAAEARVALPRDRKSVV